MRFFPHFNKTAFTVAMALSVMAAACDSADDDRLPHAPVHIEFTTVGTWHAYGVAGALDHREFIKNRKIPSGFLYSEASATGFGGVILVCSFNNEPLAYDLACPVEAKQTVTIGIDSDNNTAECPQCHSTYDIFRNGAPLGGPAADKGYALTRYRVVNSSSPLSYSLITR